MTGPTALPAENAPIHARLRMSDVVAGVIVGNRDRSAHLNSAGPVDQAHRTV